MDWLKVMTESAKKQLKDGLEITGNKTDAIKYAKKCSCASEKVFEVAINEVFNI